VQAAVLAAAAVAFTALDVGKRNGSEASASSAFAVAEFAHSQIAKEVSIPLTALFFGILCRETGIQSLKTPAQLAIYFGAQTGMLLFAKIVISSAVVSEELGLRGLPGAFLMTASHQLICFVLFGSAFVLSWLTPWSYTPKRLTSLSDVYWLLLFSATFAANIGLNNFSFQFLPLSMNLIIRSCLPIATAVVQKIAPSRHCVAKGEERHSKEILCMVIGVACAALATVAQSQAQSGKMHSPDSLLLGVFVCVVSIFAGACNMVLACRLGDSMKLNSTDITFYMGLPAAFMLLLPSCFLSHPSWPGQPSMTDVEVYRHVYEWAPGVLGLGLLLGVFASAYNVTQYAMVQSLSATYTTFAGNFNKAFTIVISLGVGLEELPHGVWGCVMLLATLGNIGSFTAYSMLQLRD